MDSMDKMADFFSVMLHIVADFLGTEPVIYLFGLICLICIVEILRRVLAP